MLDIFFPIQCILKFKLHLEYSPEPVAGKQAKVPFFWWLKFLMGIVLCFSSLLLWEEEKNH